MSGASGPGYNFSAPAVAGLVEAGPCPGPAASGYNFSAPAVAGLDEAGPCPGPAAPATTALRNLVQKMKVQRARAIKSSPMTSNKLTWGPSHCSLFEDEIRFHFPFQLIPGNIARQAWTPVVRDQRPRLQLFSTRCSRPR